MGSIPAGNAKENRKIVLNLAVFIVEEEKIMIVENKLISYVDAN